MTLAILRQPVEQLRLVAHLQLLQALTQGTEVEHAQTATGPLENILVTPPGVIEHRQGLLLLGDITQHPDQPETLTSILQLAAVHGKQTRRAILQQRQ